MKKIGLTAGISFLAGALFFALTFGYLQKSENNDTFLSPEVAQAETVKAVGLNFAPIVKKVKPAVVQVISESIVERRGFNSGDDFFDRFFNTPQRRQEKVSGAGSGFFISKDGYIITNNHVVNNAIKITIIDIANKEYKAEKIGTDPKSDLALLKIKGDDHAFIELGDSNKLEVGEWVLAIGNPFGQSLTVTSGIVSAKGRELEGLEVEYQNFIQTDAAINRGNSGGPLINMEGKAIGINSVILSGTGGNIGIGFAIPSNMARKVMKDLKKEGRVVRGHLGVGIYDIPDSEAKDYDMEKGGIFISSVEPDSPAEKAGLKKYDIVIEVNGEGIKSGSKLKTTVANLSPGDSIELTIIRGKERKKLTAVVGEAPDTLKVRAGDNAAAGAIDLGMVLMNNSPAIARRYELDTSNGIIVKEVEGGSNAQQNGLRVKDIIVSVNRIEIESISQFRKFISSRKRGTRVLMVVNRDGAEYLFRYKLPE
jgi:serine protease Do